MSENRSWQETLELMNGMHADGEAVYNLLCKNRPEDTEIIICPGHMGDTLLIAALAKEYKEQHEVKRLIYVSASLPEDVLKLYSAIDAVFMLDKEEMSSLRFYFLVTQQWYKNGIHYAHFRERVIVEENRICTIPELPYSSRSFYENRMDMMRLPRNAHFSMLRVPANPDIEQLREKYGKAVLLMPISYSTHLIREEFWEKLAETIRKKGFLVYTNYNGAGEESVIKGTEPFGSSFYEMAQMAEVFRLFVGVRSGLCDLISLTGNGELVILYNETICGSRSELEIAEDEMLESNIYDLGRRDGIFCYRYLSGEEERVIDAICTHLSEQEDRSCDQLF